MSPTTYDIRKLKLASASQGGRIERINQIESAAQISARSEVFLSFFSVRSFWSSFRCFIAARLYVIVKPYEDRRSNARTRTYVVWMQFGTES